MHFEVEEISRTLNNSADALAKLASAYKGGQREILVDSMEFPSCDIVTCQQDDWRYSIVKYLRNETQPEDKHETRKLRSRAE